jgi:hypothetical protein
MSSSDDLTIYCYGPIVMPCPQHRQIEVRTRAHKDGTCRLEDRLRIPLPPDLEDSELRVLHVAVPVNKIELRYMVAINCKLAVPSRLVVLLKPPGSGVLSSVGIWASAL